VALLIAPLDLPWYSVNGQEMRGRAFARALGVPTALMAVTMLIAGWGIHRNRRWSRPALLIALAAFWAAGAWVAAFSYGQGVLAGYLWRGLVLLAIGVLILYRLPSLRRYYEALG
jgi:hypothetical protein